MKSTDARNIVLNMLIKTLEEGQTSSRMIGLSYSFDFPLTSGDDKRAEFSFRQRAFLTRLYRGVLEKKLCLDFVIDAFSKTPVNKMKPIIRNILRMALYEIIFMDSVPDRAAVSEAVNLTKKRGLSGLSGFVNGVLRTIISEIGELSADGEYKEKAEYLQMPEYVLAGVNEWLYKKLIADLGKEDSALFFKAVNSEELGVNIRLNLNDSGLFKTDSEEDSANKYRKIVRKKIIESMEADGCKVTEPFEGASKVMPSALKISGFDSLTELNAFKRGQIFVQDINSQRVSLIAGELFRRPDTYGENNPDVCNKGKSVKILDVCAAPGGKSIDLALDYPEAKITACDVSKTRTALIEENITRLGIKNIEVQVRDALEFVPEFEEAFDAVIADLPCSGLGTIGHKPDIRWVIKPKDITSLAGLQKEILSNVCKYVKPGGILVYSVCTLTREECEEIADYIADELSLSDACGRLKLIPGKVPGDGFFIAAFRKI